MFIQPNKTKAKLKAGQPAFGVISTTDDPQLAELFGIAGFDFYMLDAEHGLIDPVQAVNVIRTCETTNMTPMVRIGPKEPKLVLQYLDAGMMGVMMPGLETVEEVKMLVDSAKYAPLGKRGLGFSRASGHLLSPEYIDFSNEQTMIIIQFEDPKLLNIFSSLCRVEGLDACVVGPRDLSLNMGFPDGPNHPEVQAMIESALQVMKNTGTVAGITAGTHADAEYQIQRGATMIIAAAQSLVLAGSNSFLRGS